jgi:hypothetical protein
MECHPLEWHPAYIALNDQIQSNQFLALQPRLKSGFSLNGNQAQKGK